MRNSPIFFIDGYKLDHRRQYPPNTTRVYSNWTPRSSRIPGQEEVVFFGLQYFIKEYLQERFRYDFFDYTKKHVVEAYTERVNGYLGENDIGSDHIAALHELGYVPLEIRALPEGTRVPLRVPMLTVENTHPDFFWLVNYIETLMSNVLWLPCTSATTALRYRQILEAAARRSGGDVEFVKWQGHDFSYRGLAGHEAACLSGAGHLLSFTGTDTIPAIEFLENFYAWGDAFIEEEQDPPLIGGSVAATEHSVMSAGGQEDELSTFERIIDLYPKGIVSIVSDTWDLGKVLTEYLPKLKDKILARKWGKVVIRPDSGNPADILCGNVASASSEWECKGVVETLWNIFGGTTNEKGYKVLSPQIGTIYGDSITPEVAQAIVDRLHAKGFASTNVVFGIGSYTYQHVTRDTFGFAMKATWAEVNGKGVDLFKAPKTDSGSKKSAKGRLAVDREAKTGRLVLIEQAEPEDEARSLLGPVFRNGNLLRNNSYQAIRNRLHGGKF